MVYEIIKYLNNDPMTDNDVLKVEDQYVILLGDYMSHDLYGNEGKGLC